VDASIQFGEWEGVKILLETDICSDFRRIQMRQKTGAPSRCAAGRICDLRMLMMYDKAARKSCGIMSDQLAPRMRMLGSA
jgi:hypothetical protein